LASFTKVRTLETNWRIRGVLIIARFTDTQLIGKFSESFCRVTRETLDKLVTGSTIIVTRDTNNQRREIIMKSGRTRTTGRNSSILSSIASETISLRSFTGGTFRVTGIT
jgi:hypothetical protein